MALGGSDAIVSYRPAKRKDLFRHKPIVKAKLLVASLTLVAQILRRNMLIHNTHVHSRCSMEQSRSVVYLDPIRVQKGMFLVSMRGPGRHIYQFRPYHWGPFSGDIYADLDSLAVADLVECRPVPGQSWVTYGVTVRGAEAGRDALGELDLKEREWMASLLEFLTSRSFPQLLKDVYAATSRFRSKF
jgi:hypothetical protein